MKKAKSLLLVAASMGLLSLGSCSNTTSSDTLNIICLNASYGDEWIKELVSKYEAKHDVKVSLTTSYNASQLISSHLSSSKNKDDLYIYLDTTWKTNAAQGKFAELDDFLNEEVSSGITVKDKVVNEYKDSLYFTKSDSSRHCYRLPWTSGIGGIYYNEAMFKTNGWDSWLKSAYPTNTTGVPETFEQLKALCDKIVASKITVTGDRSKQVKPFAYTGANTDYFDYLVLSWWGQLAGTDNIKEFLKYGSADNFDVSKNETYAALKTAVSSWSEIFLDSNNVIEGSESKTAPNAQKEFFNGMSAMMVNGDWLYNDYTAAYKETDSFKLKLMKTPKLNDSVVNANTSYIIGEDQCIAIPATSSHKDWAKDFIKLMISDEGCQTFFEKAHGFLAYNADYSSTTDEYMSSALEIRDSYTSTFTNWSDNRKYLCNYIDVWGNSSKRPFASLLSDTKNIDEAFADILTLVKNSWSTWTKNAGE